MNNYNKTDLQLNGLNIDGLYLEDVFSVWEHFDKNANKYFTVFMINNSRITVPATEANVAMLYQGGHQVSEFVVNDDGIVDEIEVAKR
ncbi:hypothetical protein [Methylophilus sp.]|uniref:hypothetical protein n=1 Tax=Methylophilus sp. TaxID=29541 RepID=UPI004036885B